MKRINKYLDRVEDVVDMGWDKELGKRYNKFVKVPTLRNFKGVVDRVDEVQLLDHENPIIIQPDKLALFITGNNNVGFTTSNLEAALNMLTGYRDISVFTWNEIEFRDIDGTSYILCQHKGEIYAVRPTYLYVIFTQGLFNEMNLNFTGFKNISETYIPMLLDNNPGTAPETDENKLHAYVNFLPIQVENNVYLHIFSPDED